VHIWGIRPSILAPLPFVPRPHRYKPQRQASKELPGPATLRVATDSCMSLWKAHLPTSWSWLPYPPCRCWAGPRHGGQGAEHLGNVRALSCEAAGRLVAGLPAGQGCAPAAALGVQGLAPATSRFPGDGALAHAMLERDFRARGLVWESCERPAASAGEGRGTERVEWSCGCLAFREVFWVFGGFFFTKKNFLRV